MKLKAYLHAKYGKRPVGLTDDEARILGIPIPLQGGWTKKYANLEITKEQALLICEKLSTKSGEHCKTAMEVLLAAYGDKKAVASEAQTTAFPLLMSNQLPDELRRRLGDSAGVNRRSITEEIIRRLEFSIGVDELRSLSHAGFESVEACHD